MKAGILDLTPIAADLRAAMPELVECGTAASFGAVNRETLRWPSAFLIPLAESPSENRYESGKILSQRVKARFGVIWAVRLTGLLALCQIEPEDAESLCEPVSGKLVSTIDRNGQMLWQDDFTVTLNRHIPLS